MDTNQKSIIRTILQSEITWLVFTIATVMAFVTTVVLPIQAIQLELVHIHTVISENKTFTEKALNEHQDLRSRVDILETEYRQLTK